MSDRNDWDYVKPKNQFEWDSIRDFYGIRRGIEFKLGYVLNHTGHYCYIGNDLYRVISFATWCDKIGKDSQATNKPVKDWKYIKPENQEQWDTIRSYYNNHSKSTFSSNRLLTKTGMFIKPSHPQALQHLTISFNKWLLIRDDEQYKQRINANDQTDYGTNKSITNPCSEMSTDAFDIDDLRPKLTQVDGWEYVKVDNQSQWNTVRTSQNRGYEDFMSDYLLDRNGYYEHYSSIKDTSIVISFVNWLHWRDNVQNNRDDFRRKTSLLSCSHRYPQSETAISHTYGFDIKVKKSRKKRLKIKLINKTSL